MSLWGRMTHGSKDENRNRVVGGLMESECCILSSICDLFFDIWSFMFFCRSGQLYGVDVHQHKPNRQWNCWFSTDDSFTCIYASWKGQICNTAYISIRASYENRSSQWRCGSQTCTVRGGKEVLWQRRGSFCSTHVGTRRVLARAKEQDTRGCVISVRCVFPCLELSPIRTNMYQNGMKSKLQSCQNLKM